MCVVDPSITYDSYYIVFWFFFRLLSRNSLLTRFAFYSLKTIKTKSKVKRLQIVLTAETRSQTI